MRNHTLTLLATIVIISAQYAIAAPQEIEAVAESETRSGQESRSGKLFSLSEFDLSAGFYMITSDTKIRLDGAQGNIGTSIDLENDLNLDEDKSTFYLSLRWRMSGRHFLELEYFDFARSGLETLTAEIEIGDEVFEVGSIVTSFFDTTVTRVSYAYLLSDSERFRLALSAGLHVTKFATGIADLEATFGDDPLVIAEVTAPLPVIGLSAAWRFSEKWTMSGRAQIFRLEVSDFKGKLDHASVKLKYDAFKHVGFGIGYDYFGVGLDVDRQKWNGSVLFRFRGPMAFVSGHF
jgi:hypothetical protein